MKYLITLICLLLTSNALAHEDHALGESVHYAYHMVFAGLCVLVAYKGIVWAKTKSAKNKNKSAKTLDR